MSARNTFAATRRSHAILRWLQSGQGVTIQRVIDNFDIQYPQAREDLKLLEELYNLATHRDGRVKVWSWDGFDPNYVSVATAASLELGAIALDLFRDTPYLDEIQRLAEHCRDRVGQRQLDRLERVAGALHLRRTWLPVDPDRVTENIEAILDAVFHDRRLAMVYARSDGQIRHYVTRPRKLVWYQGRLWLLADHESQLKLFDVAGLESLKPIYDVANDGGDTPADHAAADHAAADHAAADDAAADDAAADDAAADDAAADSADEQLDRDLQEVDLDAYFENAFGIFAQNYPVADIHLSVSGAWATYLKRYRVHPSQRVEEVPITEVDDDTVNVHFRMGLCPEFKSFVLGMIPDVEILAPVELADELRETVHAWSST